MNCSVETSLQKIKYIRRGRDPPGQKSIYIIPGDPCVETYRASTFKHLPYQVDVLLIASKGFYFTGYRDRVKCFCCAMVVENWSKTEAINFSEWHEPECDFMNGRDETNVPMFYRQRQITFNRPTLKAGSSNICTSLLSRLPTKVSGCDIQNNSIATNTICLAIPESDLETNDSNDNNLNNSRNNQEDEAELQQRREVFPCHHPVNPHMRNREVRLQTFIDRSETWPRHRINTTPQEIVDAGFFYLGERDRVKCWYCNGGLQNFERNDNAWEEHAKWFPMTSSPTSNTFSSNRPVPRVIDLQNLQKEQRKKIDDEMSSSELVANARLMGYSDESIRYAIKCPYELHNKGFSNCESLINAIMQVESEEERGFENIPSTSKNIKMLLKKKKLEKLMDSKKCKVRNNKSECMVFIPCGHLACCKECGEKVESVVLKPQSRSADFYQK